MRVVIVYESLFGNTHWIAEAIAGGIMVRQPAPSVTCVAVTDATPSLVRGADLLIVGGPTHMRGMSSRMSRRNGVQGERKKAPEIHVEPGAEGPGLRDWFGGLGKAADEASAAAFDTRAAFPMAGGAASGIARRLRRHGYRVLGTQGFITGDTRGPLRSGEVARARDWGVSLAGQLEGVNVG